MCNRKQDERGGSDTQQRAPGRESNPGPLQQGQSLCMWDAALQTELNDAPLFYSYLYVYLLFPFMIYLYFNFAQSIWNKNYFPPGINKYSESEPRIHDVRWWSTCELQLVP